MYHKSMQTLKELWGCKFTFPDNLTFKKCVCNFLDSNHVLLQSKWWNDGSILEPGMSFESIGLVLPICQQLSRLWWCKAWKSFIATDMLKGVNIKADTSIRYVRWLFDIHWPLRTFILTSNPKPHSLDDQQAFDRPEIFYLLHPIVTILILMENQDDILS